MELFNAAYIINLPTRSDRRREMIEQLHLAGIDAKDPRIVFFDAVRPTEPGGFPTIGARGCFMSHLGVLRHARQAGHERILVLEDDANFAISGPADIDLLARRLSDCDWDLVYPGFLSMNPPAELSASLSTIAPATSVMGTHMMLIRGRIFDQLIDYLERMLARPAGSAEGGPMHVDGAYSWFRRAHPSLITLVCSPALGYQRPSRTDVHQLKWFDRLPVVRSVVSELRKARARSTT
jgi:hypothetical protein